MERFVLGISSVLSLLGVVNFDISTPSPPICGVSSLFVEDISSCPFNIHEVQKIDLEIEFFMIFVRHDLNFTQKN